MSQDLVQRFLNGERRALARLLSHVEDRTDLGRRAIREVFDRTGRAHVVGITGPPGAGKSTLVNSLIRAYREAGKTVAVIAIDPSSTLSGGATLGDRIRMMENYADDGVFIRSMATRGQLGGLSLAVGGAAHLFDAYGFDLILIETVGVGQDEVDVADAADTTIVLQVPGLGDSIQTIKAGVLEIADILVVNKADRPDARQLVRDLRNMLLLGDHGDHMPPIVQTVATEAEGIQRLIGEITQHREHLEESGEAGERVRRRLEREVALMAREEFDSWLRAWFSDRSHQASIDALASRKSDPGTITDELLAEFRGPETNSG